MFFVPHQANDFFFMFLQYQGDSEMTLSEDISDNGGFKASLFAYRTLVSKHGPEPFLPDFENFTHEQLFTLAFANVITRITNQLYQLYTYFKCLFTSKSDFQNIIGLSIL